jgi:outer membrane protein assembly factor BamB
MAGHDTLRSGRSTYPGPRLGRVRWTFPVGAVNHYSSPSVGADGTVYVASQKTQHPPLMEHAGRVIALSPRGVVKWRFSPRSQVYGSLVVLQDRTVIFVDCGGIVYAVRNGALVWSCRLGRDYHTNAWRPHRALVIGPSGTIYVAVQDRLFAVSPAGRVKWVFTRGAWMRDPAVTSNGKTELVYAGAYYQTVYCIDGETGQERWHAAPGTPQNLVLAGGSVICATATPGLLGWGEVFALSPNGRLSWRYRFPEQIHQAPRFIASLYEDGGPCVLYGSSVYRFTPNGKIRWRFTFVLDAGAGSVMGAPALDHNGVVYAGMGGGVGAVGADGKMRWRLALPRAPGDGPLDPTGIAIGYDRTLYVSTWGRLYAIGE